MTGGFVVGFEGASRETAANFNGYSLIRADDRAEALELLREHPFLTDGPEYAIEVFEVPGK